MVFGPYPSPALRLTHLRDVPQNPGRITQVKHPDSPWLHLRGFAHNAGILFRELLSLDVFPPRIHILDGQAHHEIASMLCDVEGLQQEPERADLKLCNLLVAPIDRESEIGIELLGEFGVFGGQERPEIGHWTRMHWCFLTRNIARLTNTNAAVSRLLLTGDSAQNPSQGQ